MAKSNNNKRKRPSEPIDSTLPGLKRKAHDAPQHSVHGGKPIKLFKRKAPVDKSSGQYAAFDLGGDDADVEGAPLDGLSYLRMVRKEAKTVPSVMVAGAEGKFFEDGGYEVEIEEEEEEEVFSGVIAPNYEAELQEELKELDYLNYDDDDNEDAEAEAPAKSTEGESEGKEAEETPIDNDYDYYDTSDLDEAYIAPPSPPKALPPPTPYERWRSSGLLPLFKHLHETFHSTPVSNPPPKSPYDIPVGVERWNKLVTDPTKPPSFTFLRAISHDNAVKGLRFITERLKPGKDVDLSFTHWIWALFMAVRPFGELEEDYLVTLRGIGKKAVTVLAKLEDRKQLGKVPDKLEDEAGYIDVSKLDFEDPAYIAEMKRRKYHYYDPRYRPTANTLATLDMVIGLVGEVWGQRDLFMDRISHELGEDWNWKDSEELARVMRIDKIKGYEKMLEEEQREDGEEEVVEDGEEKDDQEEKETGEIEDIVADLVAGTTPGEGPVDCPENGKLLDHFSDLLGEHMRETGLGGLQW
ncbi:hypothetical protein BJ508DRAFT_418669 [Ascobolus immersus RN42]|uniref:Uncharacterized protein n=1 Tax=Ascobolus immersus RN42 TaxID=1160509 RepID=A0A3N4HRA1_ASCIM|nr:hypothetical protein BJ508DRAFT_418669 [Ascobolus immersus RN42]